jgi:hypothetical protein
MAWIVNSTRVTFADDGVLVVGSPSKRAAAEVDAILHR